MKQARYANRYGRRARRQQRGGAAAPTTADLLLALFGANTSALYLTDLENVTLRDAGGGSFFVSGLADVSGNGYHLAQATEADQMVWEVTGWNSTKGSIRSADTSDHLITTAAGLATLIHGEDTPFSILTLYQGQSHTFSRKVIGWNGATTTGFQQNAGATAELFPRLRDAALGMGSSQDTNRHSYAWSREGTTSSAWRDGTKLLNAAAFNQASIAGSTSFSLGGPGGTSALCRLRCVVVVNRAITDQEYADFRTIMLADSGGFS